MARQQPSALLLAAQLAAVLVYPFLEDTGAGRAIFSVLGILILGLVMLAVRSTPALSWVAVLLGVPATVLLLIQAIGRRDFPLVQAIAFFTSLIVIALTILTDVVYGLIDPRIRYE